MIFQYKGKKYPEYLKHGNACQFIAPIALQLCKGKGIDVGCGKWPLKGALPHDLENGKKAEELPEESFDYIFSSHCLEHLHNPVQVLSHWKERLKPDGTLFLYLPHPDMEYWLPQNCRKHLHSWYPEEIVKILEDLGFSDIIHSERDLMWSFSVVAFNNDPRTSLDTANPLKKKVEDFVNERINIILDDPQMFSLWQAFGMGIFRRSSIFHGLDQFLKKTDTRGKVCLEIGSFHGITAVVLSRYFEKVISLDILDSKYKKKVIEHLGITNIEFIHIEDNEAKKQIVEKLNFDFCYMDGDHEHDTLTDWELVKKCGHVLFHEYWEEQPPVWELVNSLKNVNKHGCLALWKV